jgi:hypothetical protein
MKKITPLEAASFEALTNELTLLSQVLRPKPLEHHNYNLNVEIDFDDSSLMESTAVKPMELAANTYNPCCNVKKECTNDLCPAHPGYFPF